MPSSTSSSTPDGRAPGQLGRPPAKRRVRIDPAVEIWLTTESWRGRFFVSPKPNTTSSTLSVLGSRLRLPPRRRLSAHTRRTAPTFPK